MCVHGTKWFRSKNWVRTSISPLLLYLSLGFSLVSKGHECNSAERFKGYKPTLKACAKTCEGSSDMFCMVRMSFEQKLSKKFYFPLLVSLFSGFHLRSKGHECNGAERFKGYKPTPEACGKACEGSSDMFVYGTNEFGVTRCYKGKGCACYCEDATKAQCFKRVSHKGYNLFDITGKSKLSGIQCVVVIQSVLMSWQ